MVKKIFFLLLTLYFVISGCRPKANIPQCKSPYNRIYLQQYPLKNHNDFDRLDDLIGKGNGVWKVYDMVIKLSPENTLARVRAAWALFYQGNEDRDRSIAVDMMDKLHKKYPNNPDVTFVSLVFKAEAAISDNNKSELQSLISQIEQFQQNFPDYKGPHKLTAASLKQSIQGRL